MMMRRCENCCGNARRLIAWLSVSLQSNRPMLTRRGLGGMKLFNIPGVVYPQSVLEAQPGMHPRTGCPYSKPPPNTLSTGAVAMRLGIRASSARSFLHRHKVRFYIVQYGSSPRMKYWSRHQVQRLLAKMPQQSEKRPRGTLTLRQAMEQLPCTRSTLQRHTANGRVRVVVRRQATPYGMRAVFYYNAADVKRLSSYLQFCEQQRAARTRKFG